MLYAMGPIIKNVYGKYILNLKRITTAKRDMDG